jgi:hypothetical protein
MLCDGMSSQVLRIRIWQGIAATRPRVIPVQNDTDAYGYNEALAIRTRSLMSRSFLSSVPTNQISHSPRTEIESLIGLAANSLVGLYHMHLTQEANEVGSRKTQQGSGEAT